MQIKLLKEIVSSLSGGPHASKVVDLLYDKKNVNEFLIAKKLGLTINQTRNILYKLADEGLVSFIRKKDSRKGGWYTYFWTLNSGKSLAKFKEVLLKKIGTLKDNLVSKQTGRFFSCVNCHIEYDEEAALLNNYTCPECGEALELKNNGAEVAVIEKEIVKAKELLVEIEKELVELNVIEQKSRERKMKAEKKKKKKEREERKREKEKLSGKLVGKSSKNISKKPSKKSKKKK